MAHIIDRETWTRTPGRWQGELQCGRLRLQLLPDLQLLPEIGGGPRLHTHPYCEIFIIRQGTGLFTVGDQEIEATAGQILIVPPNTPHKFTNLGPGPLETTDIHENGSFITEWLE